MDGPSAQGFLSLTAFQAEGCGIALTGNEYKVSVTDLHSVSYGIICILVISRCEAPPYPAAPDFPPKGETTHYDLCVAGAPSNHVRCASTGKVVAPATKEGLHFLARRAVVWFYTNWRLL